MGQLPLCYRISHATGRQGGGRQGGRGLLGFAFPCRMVVACGMAKCARLLFATELVNLLSRTTLCSNSEH